MAIYGRLAGKPMNKVICARCFTLAGCPSGQWERTVNPPVYAYEGSNPSPATRNKSKLVPADYYQHLWRQIELVKLPKAGPCFWITRAMKIRSLPQFLGAYTPTS
jgi:hypothetical protein